MPNQKKCFSCLLTISSCECFNFHFYQLTTNLIEQVSCSNHKYRTILKGNYPQEALLFLKKRLGCGGTWYKHQIEVQGKHKDKILSETDN